MATPPGPDAFLPSKEPPKPSTGEASNGGDDTLSAALDDLFSTTEVPAATTDSTDYDPAAVQKAFSETTAEVFGPKLEETEKGPDANTIADFDQSVVPSQTPAVNVVRPSIDKTLTTGPDAENNAQNSNVAIKSTCFSVFLQRFCTFQTKFRSRREVSRLTDFVYYRVSSVHRS